MPEVAGTDLAWAAGVFDHGGYIKPKNRTLYLRVGFPMDRIRAFRFQEIIGAGKIYGPYRRRGRAGHEWQYELTGRDNVRRVLGVLRPYLARPCRYDGLLDTGGGSPLGETSSSLLEEAQSLLPTA